MQGRLGRSVRVVSTMTVSFSKTFPDYRAAALWCTAHNFDGAVIKDAKGGGVTVTLYGETAIAAIEAETLAKAKMTPEAA